jgi:hypothetical protein
LLAAAAAACKANELNIEFENGDDIFGRLLLFEVVDVDVKNK